MPRCANVTWRITQDNQGNVSQADALLAVTMDLRDQLQSLNAKFASLPCAVSLLVSLLRQIKNHLQASRRCSKHPRYAGIRRPRTNCAACHRYFQARFK